MSVWHRKTEQDSTKRSLARVVLDGASHEEFLHASLHVLVRDGNADRIGIWIESCAIMDRQTSEPGTLSGAIWDRENLETPREWAHLSVEPPLPQEPLLRGKSFEQDLGAAAPNPILGLLVGLRHALWIPIERKENLKGVILAGSRTRPLASVRERFETAAVDIALAMGYAEESRLARARNAELVVAKRLLAEQAAPCTADSLLRRIAESCTQSSTAGDGPGAVFADIGALEFPSDAPPEDGPLHFHWHGGEKPWARAIESQPLAGVWRQAMAERRVIGSQPPTGWGQGTISRIVSFPLESEGEVLGILVAGLPAHASSLAAIDRLELRALLAASALRKRVQEEQGARFIRWQKALLESLSEPVLLLDSAGAISASSLGARELMGQVLPAHGAPASRRSAPEYWNELFRGRDQDQVQTWLRTTFRHAAAKPAANVELPQAELHNGRPVRWRLLVPPQDRNAAVLLEPLAISELAPGQNNSEIELQNVIEWLEEGVVLFDAHDRVRAMNTRFEQIAGFAPLESGKLRTLDGLIRRLESQAVEPVRFAERWRELARNIDGGVREEFQMAHPSPRILERAARPILDSVGRHLGRVEIYRDLTAQRLFHSKLLQTEKLAALGQMVSGIAHELSNPLTSILGYAQRVLLRQDASPRTEEVRQIYQEAERASAILRQLLLNARETLPERRLVSLNQVVQRAMDLQSFSLAAQKIRVELDLDPALPLVQGDAGHLQQVLMNLVGNARQAIEQQGQDGTIRLRTRRIGERRVLLEVGDNGPGIPQAILARIFDPFFTTKPAGVGTGLGLAIVLSVVREHGGQVHVTSPPEGGAVFQVELPVASEVAHQEAGTLPQQERKNSLAESAQAVGGSLRPSHSFEAVKGARVLVVEDEPTVARLIADVLEDQGMHVDVLMDGREALDRAARQSYDLVICDMKMPGLDGQHFYKLLERAGNRLRERFLFVTGDIIAAQTREFLEKNRLPHVAKPFRVEELTERVHAVLHAHGRAAPATAGAAKKNAARNG